MSRKQKVKTSKVEETKLKATERFNEWMRNKVQSIHYSNNEEMTKAYAVVQAAW